MSKVDIPKFRKEVMGVIEANRDRITSLESADDGSIFTFCGKNYACEITLNSGWIGYDLEIDTPDGMAGCGMQEDTDIYPLTGDPHEKIASEIYDDLLATVKAILNGHVYYSSNSKESYTAKRNKDGAYTVKYWQRKKFLFLPYSSGWSKEYSKPEFEKLGLKVLT
jgi:hypothetical protein